jgi:HlyD family secretion protein
MSLIRDKIAVLRAVHTSHGVEKAAKTRSAIQGLSFVGSVANGVTAMVLVVVVTGAVLHWTGGDRPSSSSPFVSAPVVRGDLTVRVSATGTVEPARIVDVSTELSGTIRKVHAQYNDIVSAGQLLAELETETLVTQLIRSRAALQVAKARLSEGRAGNNQAVREMQRKQKLAEKNIASERELDAATADLARTGASTEALAAEVAIAQANVDLAEANLKKARIVAPIDGVVLRRQVEPGQVIAASLQSPVLFRIAANLDQMQVKVDVDEADAMAVAAGHPAQFTSQALRGQKVVAEVQKIHFGPEVVQGVVTYKAILSFDNAALRLKPGMTVNADIYVTERRNVLLVPNAALRFVPPEGRNNVPTNDARRLIDQLAGPLHASQAVAGDGDAGDATPTPSDRRRLYRLVDGKAEAITVDVGASDGSMTEIVGGLLAPGDRVVIDVVETKP